MEATSVAGPMRAGASGASSASGRAAERSAMEEATARPGTISISGISSGRGSGAGSGAAGFPDARL